MSKAVVSGRIIPYLAFVTGGVTLGAALAVRLLAHGEFTSFGESVWWAAQTVTTVGYGDVIPHTPFSKAVAIFVMLFGVATVSLTTAVITSAVIAATQRRRPEDYGDPHHEALDTVAERLEVLERMERRLEKIERRLGGD